VEPAVPPAAPFPRRRAWIAGAAVAAALLIGFAALRAWRPRTAPPAPPPTARASSLAVLPFANVSGDPKDEYLAEGLTESLITELAKVPGLLVISRNGVAAYKGRAVDVRQVGTDLKVGHVLEGSVQRSGGQLRVTAQLIDAGSGFHSWAEKYDRPSADPFALQDEISGKVREALRLNLGASVPGRMRTTSLEAYDAYLRGRFHLHAARRVATARVRGETETAIALLEKAVTHDPHFAPAYAALANAYATLFFHADPDRRWEEKAHVAIEKALAIDPDLAEAYLARSLLSWTLDNGFPHEEALEDARRATTLDPSLIEARWMLARVYEHVGLLDEALHELETAKRLAPHDRLLDYRYGMVYLDQQKYEEALASFRKLPEGDLDEEPAAVFVFMGRVPEGLAAAREAEKRNPRNDGAKAVEALALARLDDRAGALRAVAETIRLGKGLGHFHHDEHYIAGVYALLGEKKEAVAWLRRAADHGFPCHPCFSADPHLAGLRGDPAFENFMAELRQRWEAYRALVR
jgi:TolB-like protein/Tfp pilus assembly protein PilF